MNIEERLSELCVDTSPLTDRLADDALRAGLLDVGYRTIDSPIGELLLAATPAGLVRVAFAGEGFDRVLEQLAEHVGPRILGAPAMLAEAASQLYEYFAGDRVAFDLAVDLRGTTGFRSQVLQALQAVTYGHTASYADIARALNNPKAVRAVGSACARNPVPIVVPCHRIVRADGQLGQYLGGVPAKRTLLELESRAA